ncbi:nucleotidyltransferase family protein [Phormidesmis priestleyi]
MALRDLGVLSLALFGSVARDEARSDSDVDLLVEFEPPLTFDRYMAIKFYLEDQLRTSVDLVIQKSLRAEIREAVEREAIRVS